MARKGPVVHKFNDFISLSESYETLSLDSFYSELEKFAASGKTIEVGRMQKGSPESEIVEKIQAALTFLDPVKYALPEFGIDGLFGRETSSAIASFNKDTGSSQKPETVSPAPTSPTTAPTGGVDVILMGGLDTRPGDKNISQQKASIEKYLQGKRVEARRYFEIAEILKLIEQNPEARVILFSAGGQHSKTIAERMKYKDRLFIVEPYVAGSKTKQSVQAAVSLGVPAKNLVTGPSSGRGDGAVENTTKTPSGVGHWGALEYAASLV